MSLPPTDPRRRTAPDHPTGHRVLAGLALVAGVGLGLLTASAPPAGLGATVGLLVTVALGRRALAVLACVRTCRRIVLDLFGWRRVVLRRPDGGCCP